jgi:hypothetical protein
VPNSSAARTSDVPTFNVVDAVTPVGTAPCAECRGPIVDTYYEADEGVICAACHTRIATHVASQPPAGRFSRAVVIGLVAASIGAAIYFALLAATGRDVSIVVLLVGFMVGKAVRSGARGRGGRRFQWLAVALTYLAIVTTYVPFVLKGFTRSSAASVTAVNDVSTAADAFLTVGPARGEAPAPRASLGATTVDLGALLLLAVVAPVLEGANHLLTLLVFSLALVQAWRMNRLTEVRMTGPYRVRAVRV